MRRGRDPTVIEARVIAGSRRRDRNLPRKFASSSCVDYFRFRSQDSYQQENRSKHGTQSLS